MVFAAVIVSADKFIADRQLPAKLTNSKVLSGDKILYQNLASGYFEAGPGNDSEVEGVYQLANGRLQMLLALTTVFKICIKQPKACANSPTWRPRSSFVTNKGPQFELGDLGGNKPLDAIYLANVMDKRTLCTAYNSTYGDSFYPDPNLYIVCVNGATNILTYEYISDADSIKF